jgi:hypothetical protein
VCPGSEITKEGVEPWSTSRAGFETRPGGDFVQLIATIKGVVYVLKDR